MKLVRSHLLQLKYMSFVYCKQFSTLTKAGVRDNNNANNLKNYENNYKKNPTQLVHNDLTLVYSDIKKRLNHGTNLSNLKEIATYYFDGVKGDSQGVILAMLMARALDSKNDVIENQRKVAAFLEMSVTAGLIHDDLLDNARFRDGKISVNVLWNTPQVIFGGAYVYTMASSILKELPSEPSIILSPSFKCMSKGELMQLYTKDTEDERFHHYFEKTFQKTASVIANSLKVIALVSGHPEKEELSKLSYEYGRKLGLALQFANDCKDLIGKHKSFGEINDIGSDLRDGHATASVLFAAKEFPQINTMITRHFKKPGDVEKTLYLISKSKGLEKAKNMTEELLAEAKSLACMLNESPYRQGLISICDSILDSIVLNN